MSRHPEPTGPERRPAPRPASLARGLLLRRAAVGGCEITLVTWSDGPAVPGLQRVRLPGAAPAAGRALLQAINRGAAQARGAVVAIARPGRAIAPAEIAALLRRFAGEPSLALLEGGAADPVRLAARTAFWLAAGGLEEAFLTLEAALLDLRRKAAALGYRAAAGPAPRWAYAPAAARRRDRQRLARRWPAGPPPGPPPRPAQAPVPAAGARLTIYTAITAGYDALLRQPPDAVGEAELVAFLDAASRPADAAGWRVLPVPPVAGDPVRAAKIYKVLPHRFLPQAAYSLWLDGSVMLAAPFPAGRLVELYLGDADLCLFRHGRRRCCYREAAACLALGLDRPEVIEAQMRRYRAAGHPRGAGLCEASVLLRRHSPAVAAFNEAWWQEICGGSRRDQLSIDYVARHTGVRLRHFPLSLDTPNGLFVKLPHAAPAGPVPGPIL